MNVSSLGHVVIRVRDHERSERFYHETLGIPISARSAEWKMTFFTLGQHHDFAISTVTGSIPDDNAVGLDHVAFKLHGGIDALATASRELQAAGIAVAPVDHVVSKSLYFEDPDGNRVELYIDGTEEWRDDPSLILSEARSLELG